MRYRQLRTIKLLCLPLLSGLFTLALPTIFNVTINLLPIFVLFPALGFGMGHSILLHESQRRQSQHKRKGSCSQLEKNSPLVA